MPVDRRASHAVEVIQRRLADIPSITLTRRALTEIWRTAAAVCLFRSWSEPSGEAEPEAGGSVEPVDYMAEWSRTRRVRLSRGQAMELQLALEDVGIHCEPALGRLAAMADIVRIYRKWTGPVHGSELPGSTVSAA